MVVSQSCKGEYMVWKKRIIIVLMKISDSDCFVIKRRCFLSSCFELSHLKSKYAWLGFQNKANRLTLLSLKRIKKFSKQCFCLCVIGFGFQRTYSYIPQQRIPEKWSSTVGSYLNLFLLHLYTGSDNNVLIIDKIAQSLRIHCIVAWVDCVWLVRNNNNYLIMAEYRSSNIE